MQSIQLLEGRCVKVLCSWGILVPVLNWLLIVFIIPAFQPFIEVFWGSWLSWIMFVKLLKLVWAPYKVPCRVPGRIRVIAFPVHSIF